MPFAELPSKPGAPLFYDLFGPDKHVDDNLPLLVFINGLGLPAEFWKPTITLIQESLRSRQPQMLIYDRFGQGLTTARDPADQRPGRDPGYGHDMTDVVADLHELIQVVAPRRERLVLVAHSIGVHAARLYAHSHNKTVKGLLLLDSNIGNAEFTDFWPDPQAPQFDLEDVLDEDCTLEQYIEAYRRMMTMFDSSNENPEGLDRRSVKLLLPDPSVPKLRGPDHTGLWLIVVGHDPERFAEESLGMSVPKSVSRKFTQPAWQSYNERLLKLSSPQRTTGVLIAPGCGHFIQRDNPGFVAQQVERLLGNVMGVE